MEMKVTELSGGGIRDCVHISDSGGFPVSKGYIFLVRLAQSGVCSVHSLSSATWPSVGIAACLSCSSDHEGRGSRRSDRGQQ